MNTGPEILEDIFRCHEQLAGNGKSTWSFGFEWKPQDGIVLYPDTVVAGYYQGVLPMLLPGIQIVKFPENATRQDLLKIAAEMPRALVVLCEMQSDIDHALGADLAKLFGMIPEQWLNRIIVARQLGEFLEAGTRATKFFDYFRKTDFPSEPGNRKKIFRAYDLFEDPLSRGTYLAILKRYLLQADTLVPVVKGHMYFDDLFTLGNDEILIDCGGYTGDTLQYYLENINSDFSSYEIFEPDPENFKNLQKNIAALPESLARKVHPFQLAVSQTPGTLEFEGKGALESHIAPDHATITVESRPLDMVLENVSPTFIKMDLEGFEAFALLGARALIKRSRPVMAICVYHYPFDLWELPLLINSIAKNYKFYLRAYHEMFDYVCYCVPEEKAVRQEA